MNTGISLYEYSHYYENISCEYEMFAWEHSSAGGVKTSENINMVSEQYK